MRTTLAASALSGTLVLLSLAGCSNDSEPSSAATPSPSVATSEPPSGSDEEASAAFIDRLQEGVGEEGFVHVEMRTEGPLESRAEGDTAYGPDGNEIELTMKMEGMPGTLDVVVVDDRVYLSLPDIVGRGKYFEVERGDEAFGAFQGGLSPSDSFSAIEAGLERVEEVGPDEVDGDPTTHYRLYVDADRASDATGQPVAPGQPETLVYDIWLDEDDQVRRLVYEVGDTKITMDLSDWGEEVAIETPDPEDIVQAPQLLGG